ncbi:MAG TPA: hypothetical protein VHN82_02430 [Methanoregula sp.]|nr:hypothetical protein [Methanoregula sp.]
MSEPERSPFARLVLFMICLSIAGSVLAGAHYYAVDLPAQNALKAPENRWSSATSCEVCTGNCIIHQINGDQRRYYDCIEQCGTVCSH